MPLHTAVFIRHEVLFTQMPSYGNENTRLATPSNIGKMVHYNARVEEFADKGGIDNHITLDDYHLEQAKILESSQSRDQNMDLKISEMVDYNAREGRFVGRNEEIPLIEGQISGGVWDANGLVDYELAKQDMITSGSNIIDSVFTVSRDSCEALGVTTKEDFQKLMRSQWEGMVKQWNVIEPHNIRWCGYFHVDGKMSLHVHMNTWDDSGRFSGTQDIPHSQIWESQKNIRREAYKNLDLPVKTLKGFYRDYAVALCRESVGISVYKAEKDKLQSRASEIGVGELSFLKDLDFTTSKSIEGKIDRVVRSLPDNGMGRLSYAGGSKEMRIAANQVIKTLQRNVPVFKETYEKYRDQVKLAGAHLGLTRRDLSDYVRPQMDDLKNRLGNQILKQAATHHSPWDNNPRLKTIKDSIGRQVEQAGIQSSTRNILMSADKKNGSIPEGTAKTAASIMLKQDGIRETANWYRKEVIDRAKSNLAAQGKTLGKEQAARLEQRVNYHLQTYLASKIKARYYADRHEAAKRGSIWEVKRTFYQDIRGLGHSNILSSGCSVQKQTIDSVNRRIRELGHDLCKGGAIGITQQQREAVKAIAAKIIDDPSLQIKLIEEHRLSQRVDRNITFNDVKTRVGESLEADILKSAGYEPSAGLSPGSSLSRAVESLFYGDTQGKGPISLATKSKMFEKATERNKHVDLEQTRDIAHK